MKRIILLGFLFSILYLTNTQSAVAQNIMCECVKSLRVFSGIDIRGDAGTHKPNIGLSQATIGDLVLMKIGKIHHMAEIVGFPNGELQIHGYNWPTPCEESYTVIPAGDERIVGFIHVKTTQEKILALVDRYFPDISVMKEIAVAESHLNPYAFNPEPHKGCVGSYGVLQIACGNYKGNPLDLFDIETNIKVARQVYERQGLRAWGVCRQKVDCGIY